MRLLRPTPARRHLPRTVVALALGAALTGCSDNKAREGAAPEDAAPTANVAPLPLPTLGVDHVRRMNFVYGDGWRAYDKAVAAARDAQHDTARTHVESALAKDPSHLDAHYLLGRLLARAGEHAAAVDHLVTALAGDYYQYGPRLAEEADLAEFLTTSHGQAVTALATRVGEEYEKRVASALWFVARRSTFKWPSAAGVAPASSRGELYAYDPAHKRFYRLSHTDHRVLAYVRASTQNEVALVGFHQIDRPRAAAAKTDTPATLTKAWVQLVDTTHWQPRGKRVALPAARELAIGYGSDDELLVTVTPPTGDPTTFRVDRGASKLVKDTSRPLPVPHLQLSLEEGHLVRAGTGVTAAWSGEPPTASTLTTSAGATIAVPESGATAQGSVAVAPDGARIAFTTAVDPCNQDVAPSLYVADARSGALRHVLTARSRFVPRWIGTTLLAYEDGEGAIRVWDAASGRQAYKIENPPGLGLEMLSLAPARRCLQMAPVTEAHEEVPGEVPVVAPDGPAADDDEPPLPPEEPVTMPE